ncbi:hypothetical protein Tco_1289466, partial [Tanacetum coccineum]
MVYVVNSVLASGVDMVLEKDLAGFALQEMEIHSLMLLIQTLSMIFQTFSPTLHNPSTRHTRASYVEMILTMVMIVHHGSRLSMSRNRATIKTLVIILIHEIHRVFHNNIFSVKTVGVLMKYPIDQSPPQEMSIQDMEDLKQQYLDEMKSMINQIQIKDYRNERIDICYRRECEIKIDELKGKFNGKSIEINKKKELRQLEQAANLSTYTTEPSQCFNSFYDDDDYEESTIPLNEISSVEDLVPIPSETEDTSKSDSDCDLPSYDDFSSIDVPLGNSVTFSNPLFDSNKYFTSSDDELLSDEDVPEDNVKIYLNPLFEFDNEYISSDINPLFDEVLEDIENKDSYEPALLVTPLSDANEDECFDPGGEFDEIEACLTSDSIPPGIDGADFDPEGDILLLEKLLNDDISFPLPPKELHFEGLNIPPDSEEFLDRDPRSLEDEPDKDDLKNIVKVFDLGIWEIIFSPTYVKLPFEDRHYLFFTYVIQIFLPYFTYLVESPFLLSSGSEDTIFDPGISAFHFSSLEPVASHRSGTF